MHKTRALFVLSAVLMLLFSVASPVMADPSDTVRFGFPTGWGKV
jgi:hypothetical protein